ncbi:hypothetical protein Pan153_00830 [Gimesia panareensis]|uniref:HEAT repeat protein n=1 Tax=Gimesia panareensis TaxID=2527978 RepID=A0A518FGL1_9PLAN|nr:hypothetical protein [Gimesia panareensis]QDV15469.1 hypothetical protein Pan153_00830 [Gimesia panareensis]
MAKRKSAKKQTVKKSSQPSPAKLISTVTNDALPEQERVQASRGASAAVLKDEAYFKKTMEVVLDQSQPASVRHACLQALEAASFQTIKFEKYRKDYILMMRKLARDSDPEIRFSALNTLSCEKDGYAQKRLLDGLKTPDKALVEPEVALQLLGNDVHADVYSVARELVKKPPSEQVKTEALKLLAADSSASKIFEKVLLDKSENTENRQVSAAALHSIKPKSLYKHAASIVKDNSDNDEIQATCLTALGNFFSDQDVKADADLVKGIQTLKKKGKTQVKKQATQFLKKFAE